MTTYEPEPKLPTNAPEAERRMWNAVHTYEKVKLVLLIVVLLVDIAIGVVVISIALQSLNASRSNHKSLVILECAVARSTSFDAKGNRRSPDDQRRALDRCIGIPTTTTTEAP